MGPGVRLHNANNETIREGLKEILTNKPSDTRVDI